MACTLNELRRELPPAQQRRQQSMDPATRCSSINHNPRYQLPPGAPLMGEFIAEFHHSRGGMTPPFVAGSARSPD
jgi:hypothetical protein